MLGDFPVIEEIKSEYKDFRIKGFGRAEAVEKIKYNYRYELADEEGSLLVWIGLADAQFACKELSEEIAQCGLKAIESKEGSELAQLLGIRQLEKRKERYSQPPMPERKKIREGKKFRCNWEIGDTFAYRIKGEEAEKYHLAGRYMLLRKVSEVEIYNGQIHPIVSFTLWDNQDLPRTSEDFEKVPFLRLDHGRMNCGSDQYEYRIELLFTTKRQVERLELQFIGNFTGVKMPENEYLLTRPGEILMALPKEFDHECCLAYKKDHFYRTGEWKEE